MATKTSDGPIGKGTRFEATEIDWDSTLVAGSSPMVDAILGDARLEAFAVEYGDDLTWYGDTLSPRPAWLR